MGTEDDADSFLRDIARVARAARPLARGEVVFERFVIEDLAGAGGMGAVYRALDRSTGAPVAVKVLQGGGGERERFAQEAHVLAALAHPAVVRYIAHGPLGAEQMFLAMEWLDGEDLAQRLERGAVSVSDAVAVARRAAEGLALAHARGVVHRDVKPSNLFLVGGDPARLKVLDFGVARLAARARVMTKTGAIVGTVGYMAPEQATGERDIDARADVFSLGCVLFECLTGQPAFAAEHAVAILAKVLREEAPRVSALVPAVPPVLDELVARMLAKDRSERPADTSALVAELAHLGSIDTSASPRARIASGEQRLVCVILAGGLRDLAPTRGADVVQLADGTHLVTLATRSTATDDAAQMAQLALALRDRNPTARIALAMGRAETTGRHPVGAAIDRAASLLEGEPGTVRIDAVAASLLDTRFDVRDGVLVGRTEVDEARTLLGKPTPCVGRDKELALLDATLAECISEPVARAVLVTAPPGVGKSRLRREFAARARQTVWLASADPVGAGSSLALVRQLVRAGAALRDADPGTAEFLRELVGDPSPTPSSLLRAARSDPALLAERMRRSFEDWLAAACAAQPIAIVLEDLHWADKASVEYLGGALRKLRDRPVFVLALARPEVHDLFPKLWSEAGTQEIKLGGLTRRAAERLVREVLGDNIAADTLARVIEQADGNAYYLEELIRRIAEGGGNDTFPETVLAMIESRLHRVEPEARHVLRAASVFGEVFWANGVAALLGGDVHASEWLRVLVDRELLEVRREPRFNGETEYAFRHALLRDASYAMLVEADRATAHRVAAEWLERVGEMDAIVLADHLDRAREYDAASIQWERAGDREAARSRYAEAAGSYRAAFNRAEGTDTKAKTRQLALLLKLGGTLIMVSGFGSEEVAVCYREARVLASALGDGHGLFKAIWGLWTCAGSRQEFDIATEEADALIALSDRLHDADLHFEAIHCRWTSAVFRGEAALALAFGDEGIVRYDVARHHRLAHEYGGHDPGVCAHGACATALAMMGRAAQSTTAGDRSAALGERLDHPQSLGHALMWNVIAATITRDFTRCERIATRLDALATRHKFMPTRMISEFHLGLARLRLGDIAGFRQMEAAFERRSIFKPLELYHCANMAEACLALGRLGAAQGIIDTTLANAARSDLGLLVPELWRLKGEIALAGSPRDTTVAEHAFTRAGQLAERDGAKLLRLRAMTSLARLWSELGRRQEASDVLQAALETLAEPGDTTDEIDEARLLAALR